VPSLRNRPRTRHLVERAARSALWRIGSPYQLALPAPPAPPPEPPPPPPEPTPPTPGDLARELVPGALAVERCAVTHLLFERLSPEDIAEVERRLPEAPELHAHYTAAATQATREALLLISGVWLGVPEVTEKTGLTSAQPPEDVHAMARGPLASGGGLYEADLVADALASTGVELADVRSALDFGCSSGRVLRALTAAHPHIRLHGCDPNTTAIAWASQQLPNVELFVNDHTPPLALDDASLDLAYAISIWSHFAPPLGLRWFEEMHRLIRPGGHLICTTHGPTSIAYYATLQLRTPEQSLEIANALYRQGWWYAPEFGEDGDWGVINPDWGTAFLSPEWMLTQLCPRWDIHEYAPGRNQHNQDVYVLQRA
jgi:SAM-dependent methyltransferase